MDLAVTLAGSRQAGLRFESFPEDIRAELLSAIRDLTDQLYDRVESAVPKRTGRLAGEIEKFVDDTPTRVTGRVKVVAPDRNALLKAIAEEYGAHGRVRVKGHTQTISTVFGRLVAPIEVTMAAYDRHADIAARAYERGPLDAMRPDIIARLQQAVDSATSET